MVSLKSANLVFWVLISTLKLQFCSLTGSFCPLMTTNMKANASKVLMLLGLESEKVEFSSGWRIK